MGQISEIIDVWGISKDIDAVVSKIVELDNKIAKTNSEGIQLKVDMGDIQSIAELNTKITQLNANLKENSVNAKDNAAVTQNLNQINESFGAKVTDNVSVLAEQKIQLKQVQEELKTYQKFIKDSSDVTSIHIDELNALTLKEQELKISISGTTSAIKTQIKEYQAATGSMDEMSQTLFQLKERYRALSAQERENLEIGGKLNAQIAALDIEVKKLDASIGNNQRNVGNYASGFKNVSAELSHVKMRMQEMTLAGEKGSAEYSQLSARANELSASMREVSRETGRAVFSLENVGIRLQTMVFRMGMHMLIFAAIIGSITALVSWFTKLSDAEKIASDNLKDYTDNLKELKKQRQNSSLNTDIAIEKEAEKENRLIRIILNKNSSIAAQVNAYEKLHSAHSDIIEDLTDEQKQSHSSIELNNAQIESIKKLSEARKLEQQIKERDKTQDLTIEAQRKAQSKLDLLSKYMNPIREKEIEREAPFSQNFKSTDNLTISERGYAKLLKGDKTYANAIDLEIFTHTYLAYKNEVLALERAKWKLEDATQKDEQKLMDLTHLPKDKKTPKEKKDNAKGLDAELAAEKEHYKIRQEIIQHNYDVSRKTFFEEKQKDEDQKEAAQEHANAMILIIERWHGKVNESDAKYLERKLQVTADQLAVDNAANEEERKIALEIQKRHDEANKQIDELIKKMREQRAELQDIQRETDEIRAGAAAHKERAGGISPLLEALGFDADFQENQAAFDRQIRSAKEKRSDLQDALGNAGVSGNPLEVGKATNDIAKNTQQIADLEAQKQKDIDDKVIAAKKEAAQKAIELAQVTFEAIKTIQENQFAWEQQQIEYQMQSVRLQSEQKIQAIDASTGFAITKDNEKAKVAAQTAAKENELQAKSNELKLKQAQFEKKNAEMSIIANTAAAIVKSLAQYGIPLAIPIIAIEAAIGAAQYAAAASAPLPQFFKGGTTTTSKIIAGEQGKEMGVTPQGKLIMFNKAGVYSDVPIGTNIKTADETNRILKSMVWSNYGLPQAQSNGMTDKNIVQELQETRETMMQIGMMQARQQPKVIVIKENNYLQRPRR